MRFVLSGYGRAGEPSIKVMEYENGALSTLSVVETDAPSYLALSGDRLFAAHEHEGESAVSFYRYLPGEGLVLQDRRTIPGGLLCHLSYLERQGVLAGACYETGHLFTLSVERERFGRMKSFIRQGEENVPLTRTHCAVPNREQTRLYAANIALDRLYSYSLDNGELKDETFIPLPKGVGPRHLLLDEEMDKIYVITEYSSEVITVSLENNGDFNAKSVSTLQDDFSGTSYCSTLVRTRNGRAFYAANRGENTVALLRPLPDGSLIREASYPSFGNWPRDICLLNNDKILACANQESDRVDFLPVHPKDESLGKPIFSVPLAGASCVLEWPEN